MPASVVWSKVEQFTKEIVLPAYNEMETALTRKGKTVYIFSGEQPPAPALQGLFRIMHPHPIAVEQLKADLPIKTTPNADTVRYLGTSFIVIEPGLLPEEPYFGRYFESIEFLLSLEDAVYAAPLVMYYMRFNNRFHKFQHRFDPRIEFQPLETITRYHLQNHFLDAYSFYQMYAGQSKAPW